MYTCILIRELWRLLFKIVIGHVFQWLLLKIPRPTDIINMMYVCPELSKYIVRWTTYAGVFILVSCTQFTRSLFILRAARPSDNSEVSRAAIATSGVMISWHVPGLHRAVCYSSPDFPLPYSFVVDIKLQIWKLLKEVMHTNIYFILLSAKSGMNWRWWWGTWTLISYEGRKCIYN